MSATPFFCLTVSNPLVYQTLMLSYTQPLHGHEES